MLHLLQMLINCGITKIVVAESYPDELSLGILREAGVEILRYDRGTDTLVGLTERP